MIAKQQTRMIAKQTNTEQNKQENDRYMHGKLKKETKPQEIFKNEGPPPIRNVRGEQKQNKTN